MPQPNVMAPGPPRPDYAPNHRRTASSAETNCAASGLLPSAWCIERRATDVGPDQSLRDTDVTPISRRLISDGAAGADHHTDANSGAVNGRDCALGAATAAGRDNADTGARTRTRR